MGLPPIFSDFAYLFTCPPPQFPPEHFLGKSLKPHARHLWQDHVNIRSSSMPVSWRTGLRYTLWEPLFKSTCQTSRQELIKTRLKGSQARAMLKTRWAVAGNKPYKGYLSHTRALHTCLTPTAAQEISITILHFKDEETGSFKGIGSVASHPGINGQRWVPKFSPSPRSLCASLTLQPPSHQGDNQAPAWREPKKHKKPEVHGDGQEEPDRMVGAAGAERKCLPLS